MTVTKLSVPCRHCGGTGRLPVPAELMEVLDLLSTSSPPGLTLGAVRDRLSPPRPSSMVAQNRLLALIQLGLAHRVMTEPPTPRYVYYAGTATAGQPKRRTHA